MIGALGFQILRQHALLHNESYSDFGVADAARELFWERLQKLAANHGVVPSLDAGAFAGLEKFRVSTARRGDPHPAAGRMEE